ncbi:M28 family peptidase [Acidobacteria bacterium AH-259-O06]|nr:M28 family peptidase [Acidobacteria bacterium AH-259-O06]
MRKFSVWVLIAFSGLMVLLVALWVLITQPVLREPTVRLTPSIDPIRLEKHVRTLSETFFPRNESHTDNLDRVADYIRTEFKQSGGEVLDQCYEVQEKTYCNVIALFGPETKERIVVGAHYDAFGELPGADDNASGVGGLIELAYLLDKAPLPMRVELVAYTLEEPPHFRTQNTGSAVHAASLKENGVVVRVMFSLEMIGFFSDADNSQRFPLSLLKLFYPSRGNFIVVIGKLDQGLTVRRVKSAMLAGSVLPVYSINAPAFVPGIDWSDHLYYWEAGYKAVMISDTSFYRNGNYHTPRDTPATLDYQRMAMVVQGVYAAVLALSQ